MSRTQLRTLLVTPSLGARFLIMSAYLYYRRHSPLLTDGEYDILSEGVAARWNRLDPIVQWQLSSRLEIVSTGSHIKVTRAAERGAIAWHTATKGRSPHGYDVAQDDWVYDDARAVYWSAAEP